MTGISSSLDERQTLLYRESLTNSAWLSMSDTYADIQELASKNPRARQVINTILITSLTIRTDQSTSDIQQQSPALIAALESQAAVELLKKQLTPADVKAILDNNLSTLRKDDADALDAVVDLQRAVSAIGEIAKQDQDSRSRGLALQQKQELESLKLEAAHTAVYLLTTFLFDSAQARHIQAISDNFVQAYSAVSKYADTISRLGSASSGYAETVLLGNEANLAISLITSINSSDQTAQQAILEELSNLRQQIAALETMIAGRFDRLESILDADTQLNLQLFDRLILQGNITQATIGGINETLFREEQSLYALRDIPEKTLALQQNADFVDLQHE